MTKREGRGRAASARTVRAAGANGRHVESDNDHVNGARRRPCYDGERGELRLGDVVVKRFTQRSDAQAVILAAFEEEGWPEWIDDPLPGRPGLDPKQRLRMAVANLNRRQRESLLHFGVCGQGTRVSWEFVKKRGRNARERQRQ